MSTTARVEQPVIHLSSGRRWTCLAVLVVAQLAVWLDNTILNVALKTLADPTEGLGATTAELEWSISSYTLVFAVLLFPGGILGDRYGRRRTLLVGMLIFGGASAWAGYAEGPGMLIAARAVMGVGSALVLPATLSIITNVFDDEQRPTAIAIWSGFSGLAIALGPLLGGALLERYWWGSVFLVNVPVALAAIGAGLLFVPESKDSVRRRFDPIGVLLSITALTALVFGIIRGGQTSDWAQVDVVLPILAGLALLAAFVVVETRVPEPSLDVRLFANPTFTAASTAVMLTFFGLMGSMFYAVFYLQGVRDLSPFTCGLVLLPVAVGVGLGAPLSARLVRRFGLRTVSVTGLVTVVASLAGYALLTIDTPLAWYCLLIFVQGFGMGAVAAPTTEAIMSTLPRERAGSGSAVSTALRQVGGVLGVAVLGSILAANYRGNVAPSLEGVPPASAILAGDSIEATRLLAEQTGQPALSAAANQAYVDAMGVTTLVAAAVALLGVIVLLVMLPRDRGGRHAHSGGPGRRGRARTTLQDGRQPELSS